MLAPSYVSTGNLSGSLEAASKGLFKCFAENSFKANVVNAILQPVAHEKVTLE